MFINKGVVSFLNALILCLALTGYLYTLKNKTKTIWWLIAFLTGLSLFFLSAVIGSSMPGKGMYELELVIGCLIGLSLIQFAYHFPHSMPRQYAEANRLLVITIGLNLLMISYSVLHQLFNISAYDGVEVAIPIILSEFFWAILVLFRRAILFSHHSDDNDKHDLYATRGMLLSFCFLLFAPSMRVITHFLDIPPLYAHAIVMSGVMLFIFTFVLVFINYRQHAVSFMVKLVGISLITMLLIVGNMWVIMLPMIEELYQPYLPPTNYTLQIQPNQAGSYRINKTALRFDDDIGTPIDNAPIHLPFAFPFYEQPYSTIYLDKFNAVRFTPQNCDRIDDSAGVCIITFNFRGVHTDMIATKTHYKVNSDKVVITWQQVGLMLQRVSTEPILIQLVLHQNGDINLSYKNFDIPYGLGELEDLLSFIALYPGGGVGYDQLLTNEAFFEYDGAAPIGIVRSLETEFAQHETRYLWPLIWVIIGTSGLIIFGFPRFFRTNLVRPLNNLVSGVTAVNQGDLTINVPVQYADEIGFLTKSFNGMVDSLRRNDALKDQFLANTSHELRTPLNGIIGLTESLIDGATGELSDLTKQNLSLVVTSGKRLANLVNDILDFSKLKNQALILQQQPLDLRTLTDVVLMLSQPLLGNKSIELINDIPPDVSLVHADENRVQQIMHNLVGNAIKFTESGQVKISATTDLTGFENLSGLIIRVHDTGIGIPKEKQAQIFKSFEQADGSTAREYGGTGLGLSVTKQLVGLHDGDIWVESEVGKGSTFCFTLPLSEEQNPTLPYKEREHASTSPPNRLSDIREAEHAPDLLPSPHRGGVSEGQYQVLIVDDEQINLQVLNNHLAMNDYSVTQAMSGMEALEILEKQNFDVIILDIMMPKMSGYEVCKKIREIYPAHELPVLMLTAKNQVDDLLQGFGSGANDYLTKPFSKDVLLARIRTHIHLAQLNQSYSRFVPHEYLEFLHKESIMDVKLGDHVAKEMVVMFSDIRDFTSLSQTMTPKESFDFVNAYLKRVSSPIHKHHGIVIKYIGDAVMAVFPSGVKDAVQSCIAQLKAIEAYNLERVRDGWQPIYIGLGLHIGYMMVGMVGENTRIQGDVLSDSVNLTSRLEGLTKYYGTNLIISQEVVAALSPIDTNSGLSLRFLDKVVVKGRNTSLDIYEVLDGLPTEKHALKQQTLADFEAGIAAYQSQDFEQANSCFERVLTANPSDKTAQLYNIRINELLEKGVPTDWDGITWMTEK